MFYRIMNYISTDKGSAKTLPHADAGIIFKEFYHWLHRKSRDKIEVE
jgi:hypothetical protein